MVEPDEPAGFDSPSDRPASNPRIEELRGRDDAVLSGGERHDGVHFCTLEADGLARVQKSTYTVRFAIIADAGRGMLQKCTVARHGPEHPTGTLGPTPSMPQLKQMQSSYDTES